jgi:hypothetical protein
MERALPVGAKHWDSVTSQFNEKVADGREREKTALWSKFNQLKETEVPTGNPNIPPAAEKAKYIHELLMH